MKRWISFLQRAQVWLGPRSVSFDLLRIYTVGLLIAFFFLYFGNFWIESGGYDYVRVAQAILHGTDLKANVPNGPSGRDIGMALIWLISGYPLTQSLTGVVIIQVLMGLAIPLLSYLALRPWFPRAAYFTSLAACISLSPILMMKFIQHDQPYIFFTIVTLFLFNQFIRKRQSRYLYALCVSVFVVGLIRLSGTGLFWLLMPVCALYGGKKSYAHVVLATALFLSGNAAYSKYRTNLMGELALPGLWLFHNIYVNTADFGVELSPALGPNMTLILNRAYECALPSPAQSSFLKGWNAPPNYLENYFYKYTATELVERITTHANTQYAFYVEYCASDKPSVMGHILMGAWLEVVRAHPLYFLELLLRNSVELLYDPGWLHNLYDSQQQFKGGLMFNFGDNNTPESGGPIGDARFPKQALREAAFTPLIRQSKPIRNLYFAIYNIWHGYYEPVTVVLGCFAWFAWFSTTIGLLQKLIGKPTVTRWSQQWQSDQVIPASIGITILLLANVGVTAVAEEPRIRYDFSLLMLKIMLGGVGCAVMIGLLTSLCRRLAVSYRRSA